MGIWIAAGIVLVLLAVLFGAAGFFFRFAILRAKKERTDEEYEEGNSIWNPCRERMREAQSWIHQHTAEHVSMVSFDGLKLSALYLPAETAQPKGTMIVMHGYRSLATIDFALEAEFLYSLGYRLLIPYQRAHGESEGKYITYGARERFDCRDWARYAQERFGTRQNIFLMGISMGASTVLMASGLELPDTVRGIVADCGFTSPWNIMAHVAKRDFKLPAFPLLYALDLLARIIAGFGLREADTRRALQKNTRPVLFLHGREDDFVPLRMTEENSRACKAEQELYLVRGAGHAQSFARDTAGCEEKIRTFVRRWEK